MSKPIWSIYDFRETKIQGVYRFSVRTRTGLGSMYTKGYRLYPDDTMDPPGFVAYGKKGTQVKLPKAAWEHVRKLAIRARSRHEKREDPAPQAKRKIRQTLDVHDFNLRVLNKFVQLLGQHTRKIMHTVPKRPAHWSEVRRIKRYAGQKTRRSCSKTRR